MEAESSEYDDDEDDCGDDYYTNNFGEDDGIDFDREEDPEFFSFSLVPPEEAKQMFDTITAKASKEMQISTSIARLLLIAHKWNLDKLLERHRIDPVGLMIECRVMPKKTLKCMPSRPTYCPVCFQRMPRTVTISLPCGHFFCDSCWSAHFASQLQIGVSSGIECMNCNLLVGETVVLNVLKGGKLREKFINFLFNDQIKTFSKLRWCPGINCGFLVRAEEPAAKRVICSKCNTMFCFSCGEKYHAPTDCATIRKWLTKCEDDSETANYITANTKDCPECGSCIEKNGGCNHMQCIKCKHDFCWMCMGTWKSHGSEYYECSRYKSNPNIANESAGIQAREALKKYLFYFERWQNHADSLKKEAETQRKINQKIQEKVNNNIGTWIDWQYLLNATSLLAKCRYTLMYTYPYAYFIENGRKKLFEYQQAQLEVEIENLSWKLERDDSYSRGDFENQMDIAEKRRQTLLKDFSAN
ncbi:predicted protein [Nematostella vectensis]|uniref:RBR-type E3 ubiquitin transferase n=2 Tax=Nematostella vectensis TaxID=45351 RepID=A7RK36_NEMVE|nr:predicted protein [Nematostella vectensis]|eukprot:XP_001640159.1 predicted protein [Nematostella vectensis]